MRCSASHCGGFTSVPRIVRHIPNWTTREVPKSNLLNSVIYYGIFSINKYMQVLWSISFHAGMTVYLPDFSPCVFTLLSLNRLLKPFYSSDVANVRLMNCLHIAKPSGKFLVSVSCHVTHEQYLTKLFTLSSTYFLHLASRTPVFLGFPLTHRLLCFKGFTSCGTSCPLPELLMLK